MESSIADAHARLTTLTNFFIIISSLNFPEINKEPQKHGSLCFLRAIIPTLYVFVKNFREKCYGKQLHLSACYRHFFIMFQTYLHVWQALLLSAQIFLIIKHFFIVLPSFFPESEQRLNSSVCLRKILPASLLTSACGINTLCPSIPSLLPACRSKYIYRKAAPDGTGYSGMSRQTLP